MSATPPRLETERLVLRGPQDADFDAYAGFLADSERAEGFGREGDRPSAWRWFALNVGHWTLRGYGYFTIELKESGAPCGMSGIWNPEGWPEPEVGWALFDGFEGRGIAFEAAARARRWAYEALGMPALTSNIKPGNARSIALAERLGATLERSYRNPYFGETLLYRHPGPEAA